MLEANTKIIFLHCGVLVPLNLKESKKVILVSDKKNDVLI